MIKKNELNTCCKKNEEEAVKEIEKGIDEEIKFAKLRNQEYARYSIIYYPDYLVSSVIKKYEEEGYYIKKKYIIADLYDYFIFFDSPDTFWNKIKIWFKIHYTI